LPWSGLDRGLVWGEVHDENAYSLDGVAGHAGAGATARLLPRPPASYPPIDYESGGRVIPLKAFLSGT
ncbi:hypothetical protein ACWD7Y_31480, partial [Streptomyces drozdowiczii]